MTQMRQVAPWPMTLADMIGRVQYRPGWTFELKDMDRGQGAAGLTLIIRVVTVNSYEPYEPIAVAHLMPVPPASFDGRSWQRWLFDQCLLVDRHEGMEFFTVGGVKPYAPSHGPGNDPYLVREYGTDEDRRMSFRGELSET